MKKVFSIVFFSLLFMFSLPVFAASADVDDSFIAFDFYGNLLSDTVDFNHIVGTNNENFYSFRLSGPNTPQGSSKVISSFSSDYNFEGHTICLVFAAANSSDFSINSVKIFPNGDFSADQKFSLKLVSTSNSAISYYYPNVSASYDVNYTVYLCTVTIPYNHNLSNTRKFIIDLGLNDLPTSHFIASSEQLYYVNYNLLACYDLGFINQYSFSSGYLMCNNKFLPLSSEGDVVHARIGSAASDNRVRYYGPRDDIKFYFAILYPSSIDSPSLVWGGTSYTQNDYLQDSLPPELSGYRLGFFVGLPMVSSSSYRSFRLVDSGGSPINSAFLYSYSIYNEIYDSELHSIINSLSDFNEDQNIANTNLLNKLNQIYLESVAIHNILDSGGETASEAVSAMEEAASGNDELIRDSTVSKPSISYSDPMSSLNVQANGTFTQLMASITSNVTVRKMLLMVSLVALSSYVIFGRK